MRSIWRGGGWGCSRPPRAGMRSPSAGRRPFAKGSTHGPWRWGRWLSGSRKRETGIGPENPVQYTPPAVGDGIPHVTDESHTANAWRLSVDKLLVAGIDTILGAN